MKLAPSHVYQLRSSVPQILAQVHWLHVVCTPFLSNTKRAAGGNNMLFAHIKLKWKEKRYPKPFLDLQSLQGNVELPQLSCCAFLCSKWTQWVCACSMDPSQVLDSLLFSLRLSHYKAGEGFSSTSITQSWTFIGLLRSLRENCKYVCFGRTDLEMKRNLFQEGTYVLCSAVS